MKISTQLPVDAVTIPVSYTRWISRALGLDGSELPKLLELSDLSVDSLADDETLITVPQQVTILENAVEMAGDGEFGLRLGQLLTPPAHGPLGYLALSSPDLQTAIAAFVEFLPTRVPFARLSIETQGDWLIAHLDIRADVSLDTYRCLVEACTVSLQSVVEYILGRPLSEARAAFAYPDPGLEYQRYLHFPVSFDSASTYFLLPMELAKTVNASPDHANYAFALQQCRQQLLKLRRQPTSATQKVKTVMLTHTAGSLSEEQVASELFITKRTLARRLAREGTSYRQLRDMHLALLAQSYLHDTSLSVEVIAHLLGYHDSASFRKAFKRWRGMTPQQYRELDSHSRSIADA